MFCNKTITVWFLFCFILFVWVFAWISRYVPHVLLVPTEARREGQIPWNWSYMWLWAVLWVLGNQILQRTSQCSYVLSPLSSSGSFYKRWETAGEVVDHLVKCLLSKPKELSLDPQHVKGQAWDESPTASLGFPLMERSLLVRGGWIDLLGSQAN